MPKVAATAGGERGREAFWEVVPGEAQGGVPPVFKIEVFSALQMRFGPSKYTSLKTTLHNATLDWK
jgi:hypothetical protein